MPFPRPFSRRVDDPLGLFEAGVAGKDARMMGWIAWSVDAQRRFNPVVVVRATTKARGAWVVSAAHRWLAILNSDVGAAIAQMMRQDCGARSLEEHATRGLVHAMGVNRAERSSSAVWWLR
jgi:hypothetical protein